MGIKSRVVLLAALVAFGVAFAVLRPHGATSKSSANNVLDHAIAVDLGKAARAPHEAQLSGGVLATALEATGLAPQRAAKANEEGGSNGISSLGTQGCQNTFGDGDNVRVNQDCSLRRQAEEVVVVNPTNEKNLIAGQNDSRVGFNHCGYDWSFDSGKTWGDQIPPFYQFILLDTHTADACSDPGAAFDSKGNAYVDGIVFDALTPPNFANAILVEKSNAPIGGAFYHTPDSSLSFQTYRANPPGVVANDNDPNIFNDKPLIVADATASSPKADNVYVTWTRFNGGTGAGLGFNSPIYFSQSTDGGKTWSPGIEITGAAPVCTTGSGSPNADACDQDQGSHPIVGPDGTIYVAFGNGNTPDTTPGGGPGINQHLIVKCPPSADCSNKANWTTPVKITDDFGTQPIGPDATTGCPGGRQCLPPNGYRLDDFTEGSLSIDRNGKLYFVWADFRNGASPCTPLSDASTATPPCDNDVFYEFSTDGGATWSPTVNVTPASKFGSTAQWQPWSAVAPNGKKLFIGYYDRSHGNCEFTGCNDITLATVGKPATSSPTFHYARITTSSMPNLTNATDPIQSGFLGDYMWVTVNSKGDPLLVWADTRGRGGAVEEDVYFANPSKD